jgi:hypothetical protein
MLRSSWVPCELRTGCVQRSGKVGCASGDGARNETHRCPDWLSCQPATAMSDEEFYAADDFIISLDGFTSRFVSAE